MNVMVTNIHRRWENKKQYEHDFLIMIKKYEKNKRADP